jgi:hypothetical protein
MSGQSRVSRLLILTASPKAVADAGGAAYHSRRQRGSRRLMKGCTDPK